MKRWTKIAGTTLAVAALSFVLFSLSCSSGTVAADAESARRTGNTVFGDTSPAVQIPTQALSVIEALQQANRAVSAEVLPSVVEVDVVETKTRQVSSMNGFPFNFFFGDGLQEETQEYETSGLGSGVIVRKNKKTYYALTNYHVAGEASKITVKLYDGTEIPAELVGADERKDIALVSFESDDELPVAKLGDSDALQVGDICFAMGTPLGYASSVSQGIVSALGRSGATIGNISDFIQTDAAINQGNSGGPLVNIYGEIVGINTWIASSSGGSQGLGFSIPINNIKRAIDSFIKDGKVTYGWMGVSLVSVNDEYKEALGVAGKSGAFASQVFQGSPAAKGGLQAGDYVVSLNGKAVKDVDQLVRDVGDLTVGEVAEFTVIRGGKELTVKATIEARNDTVVSNDSNLWPGFIAYPLTSDLRDNLKITDKKVQGVVVTNIQSKSPAAAMRLQTGDVITAVNDVKVTNLKEFYAALDTADKKEVWFDVYSDGHTMSTARYKLSK